MRIAVFHPGAQHSYQTALAFQGAGRLAWFATEIFYCSDRKPYTFLRYLTTDLRRRLERDVKRRYHAEIDTSLVRTLGYWEWIERISMRLGLRRFEHYANEWGNQSFAQAVAAMAVHDRVDCVWGFDTSSLPTFRAVKPQGINCVLEQTVAYPRLWNQLLTEERERLGSDFDQYPRPYPEKDLIRVDAEIALADQIVCGSGFVRQTLLDGGVDSTKLNVIPYGVDTEVFTPADSPTEHEGLHLLFVGHFGLRKGAWYLIEAMRRLRDRRGLRLTVVGKQTVASQYLAPLGDQLRLIDHVPYHEMPDLYRQADALVLPSLFEGSSLAIYEALACGVPVITTPNAGSIIQDGAEGYIVPIRDVDGITSKIDKLYTDREARANMAVRARHRALEFGWRKYADGLLRLSERVIGPSHASDAGEASPQHLSLAK